MLDTSPLSAVVERFADWLRAAPQSRLQQGAAETALELARELSARAQRLEQGPEQDGPARRMPEAGLFVVGDQVAVAGLDLAEALRTAPPGTDATTAPSEVLDEAVRLVEQAEVRAKR
ncbi:hypothetical protein ACWGF3_18370 [Streptomyces xanthophaeus]|uniref:hypothetical protein n=1 Tax=Streptomyces xanthophaeus TaxID=67385 RepID=UPI0004CDBB8D|nr:hypothetical protein [Streptomyces xanthophaeus]WST22840.1 hypothetical protein OG264_15895 [Streptomyces xanthophaeus]WST62184.1 hypothetical protein OG605_22540 [Streptomyces xanthophaeus]